MENNTNNKLQKLVASIKSGERFLFFAPGIFSFVAVVMFLIFATIMLVGSFIAISSNSDTPTSLKVGIQFASMGGLFVFVIFPGLMIIRGKKQMSSWILFYGIVLALTGLSLLIVNNLNIYINDYSSVPIILSLCFSLAALLLMRTSSFLLLPEFFYLLKKK